jgi:hypothetical protein
VAIQADALTEKGFAMPMPELIGHRRDGRPIYTIRGASTPVVETLPPPTPPADPPAYVPPASQEDLDKIITDRLQRERAKFADAKEWQRKAQQFDALEEKNKTDLQKEQDRAAAAEKRATEAETKALRAEVALEKGIPANLLAGTTKEELEASAAALIAFRGAQPPPPKQPIPGFTPGAEPPKKAGREAGLTEAERRFGKKTT